MTQPDSSQPDSNSPIHNIVHKSVLQEEAVSALLPEAGNLKSYVDATLGGGGHTLELANRLDASNRIIGIDQDPVALEKTKERLAGITPKLTLIQANFGDIRTALFKHGITQIDGGILLDLGVSDFQLRTPERGFSFRFDAPLDMRMNPDSPETAADLVNNLSQTDLANLLFQYADEKLSRPIARTLVEQRPIETTKQVATIVSDLYRQRGVKAHNIHPATRTFQALRIAVNREMDVLSRFLEQLPDVLAPGARVALITFHSIEDRLVKKYFQTATAECLCPPRQPLCTCDHKATFKLLGKPITASDEECERNPQARSAKLRVAERI